MNTTLAMAAIVAAVAITAVAFAIPQSALAYGIHNHKSNSIEVSQDISQANVCSNSTCINGASNSADVHR
jgi:hypothetical protein